MAELAAVGQARFTMDGVAKRSYYSPGAVYERWHDRTELIADIGRDPIVSGITASLAAAPDAAAAISWVLDDGRPDLQLAGEVILAGHTMPAVRDVAIEAWAAIHRGLGTTLPRGMAWYVTAYALGNALLDTLGMPGPGDPASRVPWLVAACELDRSGVRAGGPPLGFDEVDLPDVPLPLRNDSTTQALIEAAREILSQEGAEGITTRKVSQAAGVTTGAMYRRYEGKADLLADVLLTQLGSGRYSWTWDFVRALADDDPYRGAAMVLAQRLITAAQDLPAQEVLLQIGVAARGDDALRAQVQQRIMSAHEARHEMLSRFADVGLLRSDIAPDVLAWSFQTVPVGVRLTLPLGIALEPDVVCSAMAATLAAAAA